MPRIYALFRRFSKRLNRTTLSAGGPPAAEWGRYRVAGEGRSRFSEWFEKSHEVAAGPQTKEPSI